MHRAWSMGHREVREEMSGETGKSQGGDSLRSSSGEPTPALLAADCSVFALGFVVWALISEKP